MRWLTTKNLALLADEMGLGKSCQAITAADSINAQRLLVLCPAVARVNWHREFEKFSTLKRNFTLVFSKKDKIPEGHSVICSYDLASEVLKQTATPFDALILDEQHYLKSPDTKRTEVVYGIQGLCRMAKRIWALSGTPAPNHAGELWPILFTFGVTKLSFDEFIKNFCDGRITTHGFQITGTKVSKIPELKLLLSKIMLRRTKENVMKELPPIEYRHVMVEPSTIEYGEMSSLIQWVFPQDRRKELEAILTKQESAINGMLDLAKESVVDRTVQAVDGLRAVAKSVSTLRMHNGIQKIKSTVDLLKFELESNAYDKVVVFAFHRDVIEGLRSGLRDFNPVTLYGGTPTMTGVKNIDKFQNNPKCRVFIGQILACGTAINLTAAHNVVFVEQDWVPGNNAQAAMRVHRYGQTKPVTVRILSMPNSIDERVNEILRKKTRELTEMFL